jgi:hypothetical protein
MAFLCFLTIGTNFKPQSTQKSELLIPATASMPTSLELSKKLFWNHLKWKFSVTTESQPVEFENMVTPQTWKSNAKNMLPDIKRTWRSCRMKQPKQMNNITTIWRTLPTVLCLLLNEGNYIILGSEYLRFSLVRICPFTGARETAWYTYRYKGLIHIVTLCLQYCVVC